MMKFYHPFLLQGLQVGNGSTSGGKIEFLEDTDNGTNKVTLEGPDSIATDYTLELPSSAGTLATIEDNAFTASGSFPAAGGTYPGTTFPKQCTAPLANEYIFNSGISSNGSCQITLRSDSDNGNLLLVNHIKNF